jgi:nucleoside-diphosphate-sugar epimerase
VEDLDHVLKCTRPLWERARGRRLFISGGTGFFGAWLIESLAHCNRELKLNVRATVLTRNPQTFGKKFPHLANDPCIAVFGGDVRDFAFPEHDFDYIIHGAASTSYEAASRPLELMRTLVKGTEHMLEFAQARNARGVLFVSSGAVYGPQPPSLSHIPETYLGGPDWLSPNAVYAEGKRIAEQMCSIAAAESGIHVAIGRCFAFVGPHLPLDQHFAIGNFIGDALAGRDIAVRGDGTPMRSYLYAADLAVWLWTLLFHESERTGNPIVINVGSGDAISVGELAHQVVKTLNPALKVETAMKPEAGVQRQQYVPDVQKAEDQFDLRPVIGLQEAIRRTANWYRVSHEKML